MGTSIKVEACLPYTKFTLSEVSVLLGKIM